MTSFRDKITSIRARVGYGFVSKDPHPEDQNREVATMRNIVNTMEEAQNMTQTAGIDPIKVAPPTLTVTEAFGKSHDREVQFMKGIVETIQAAELNANEQADALRDQVVEFMQNLTTADCETFARDLRMAMDAIVINRLGTAGERNVIYVDTGNMPAEEARQAMESIKSRIAELSNLADKLG